MFNGSYLIELLNFSVWLMSATVSNSKSFILQILYRCLVWLVQVRVVIWQKLLSILIAVSQLFPCLLWGNPSLLLLHMSDELNWVAAPHLHRRHQSSWRHYTVGWDDGSFLNHSSFQNNRIVSNVSFLLQDAWIQSASVLNNNIILNLQMCRKPWRSWSSSMQHAVVTDIYISVNPLNYWKST